jgi:hypothetical protein
MLPAEPNAPIWVSEPQEVGSSWECYVHVQLVPGPPFHAVSETREGALYFAARFLEMVLRDFSDLQPPLAPTPDPPELRPWKKP